MASEAELYKQFLYETGKAIPDEGDLYQQFLQDTKYQETPKVLNESDPEYEGRTFTKNFGGNPEGVLEYLKTKNPGFETTRDTQGATIYRKPGEKDYKRLDPKGFDLKDITDVLYDVPAAIVQGIGSSAAGVGAAALGPWLSLPAASATSAAIGGGLEGIRQGIGSMYDIPNNYSGTDLTNATISGALTPFAAGTGATGKQAYNQAVKMGGKELTEDALSKITEKILSQQRGIPGRVWDAAAGPTSRTAAQVVVGYNPEVLKAGYKNMPEILAAKTEPKIAVDQVTTQAGKINDSFKKALGIKGKDLENLVTSLDQNGATSPTSNLLTPIKELIEQLKSKGVQSEARKDLINKLEGTVQDNFAVKTEVPQSLNYIEQMLVKNGVMKPPAPKVVYQTPSALKASDLNDAYYTLKGLASDSGVDLSKLGQLKSIIKTGSMNDMRVARAFNTATQKAKEGVSQLAEQAGKGKEYKELNADYSALKQFQEIFNPATKDPAAYQKFLSKKGIAADYARERVSDVLGEDVTKLGNKIQAFELFTNPGWQIPAFGNSNTFRNAIINKAVGPLGLGAATPAGIKGIMRANDFARKLPTMPGGNVYPYLMMNPSLHTQGE